MNITKIEWTEVTWNPITGCSKISPGCQNCYAEKMALRLQAMNSNNYKNGFQVTCHEHVLSLPLKWQKSRTVFVNSMSDIFHEDVSTDFILKIFRTMNLAEQHTFQLLTKRTERLIELNKAIKWSENIWMGTTVESAGYKYRIGELARSDAKIKFLSIEPLLEDLGKLELSDINWVIVGGESGPNSRPMEEAWVLNIKNQCHENKIPFFFKQWGGRNKKKAGRLLNGRTWDEQPKIWR